MGESPAAKSFALLSLAACLLLVAGVTLLNSLADPYGSLGTGLLPVALDQDRSVKSRRAASLAEPPGLVVLGSSRARLVDERRTTRTTGLRTFNAAVTDGRSEDAFAFARLIQERFPDARPDWLWILDLESFRARPLNPLLLDDRRLARQFPLPVRLGARLTALGGLVSWAPLRDSWRVLRRVTASSRPARAEDAAPRRAAEARPGRSPLRRSISSYRQIHQREFPRLDPQACAWFERTVEAINQGGGRPVVVLAPYHPSLLRALGDTGLQERRRELGAWLESLPPRLGFTYHDMADIASFGGSGEDFTDGVHMKRRNLDRLVDEAIRRGGGALH